MLRVGDKTTICIKGSLNNMFVFRVVGIDVLLIVDCPTFAGGVFEQGCSHLSFLSFCVYGFGLGASRLVNRREAHKVWRTTEAVFYHSVNRTVSNIYATNLFLTFGAEGVLRGRMTGGLEAAERTRHKRCGDADICGSGQTAVKTSQISVQTETS